MNWQQYGERISSCLGARWNPQVDCSEWIEWYLDAIAAQVSQAERGLERSFAQLAVVLCGFQGTDGPSGARRLPCGSRTALVRWPTGPIGRSLMWHQRQRHVIFRGSQEMATYSSAERNAERTTSSVHAWRAGGTWRR